MAELMLGSATKLAAIGAGLLICPDLGCTELPRILVVAAAHALRGAPPLVSRMHELMP